MIAPATEGARRTAAMIRMARRVGTATRRRRVPRTRYPHLIESEYARELVAIIRGIRAAVAPAIAAVPRLIEEARRLRGDELEPLLWVHRCGLTIAIENRAGSVRRWTEADGTEGSTRMLFDYGYLDGFIGADGDEVDVYMGPEHDPSKVFVVHQQSKESGFTSYDEDKVMLGWLTEDDARVAYLTQYDDRRFFGGMTVLGIHDFKARLRAATGRAITDAVTFRADGSEVRQIRILLDHVRDRIGGSAGISRSAERAAEKIAGRVSAHSKAELARQVRAALGIDLVALDPRVPALMAHFAAENAALIRSLGAKAVNDVEKVVTRAFTEGRRAENLQEDIADRFDVSERHARLIARDQIGKLNGQVSAARHQEIGLTRYRWLTMRDERVRPEHQERDQQIYAYKGEGAAPALPGEEIMCRCVEEPMFDDVMELAGGEAVPSKPATRGAPERFIQPWDYIPHDTALLPETIEQIRKLDLNKLARTLLDSGIDEEAVTHVLYRAKLLKLRPETLAVPSSGAGGTYAWDMAAKSAHTSLTDAQREDVQAILARAKAPRRKR